MRVSYKKLWKLLIDKDMNKTDLRNATGISSFTIARMTRGEDVSTAILKRISAVMKCDIGDIVEFRFDELGAMKNESSKSKKISLPIPRRKDDEREDATDEESNKRCRTLDKMS